MAQSVVASGMVYGNNLNKYILGNLKSEATAFTAEMQAIETALSLIGTSNELWWTIFSDSQALNQQSKKRSTLKANPGSHDLALEPKQRNLLLQCSQSYQYGR